MSKIEARTTQRTYLLLLGLAVALPAAILPIIAIYTHFLKHGAYYLDSGFFAYLLTDAGLKMQSPAVLNSGSYLSTHVSPTFYLFQFISSFFSLTPHFTFALWQACIAVTAVMAAYLTYARSKEHNPKFFVYKEILALTALPFSGLAIDILGYPHTESLAVSLMCLNISLLFTESKVTRTASWIFFALALGVREDVGFHYFALCMTYLVLAFITKKTCPKWPSLLAIAIIGFIYSAAVVVLQKKFFPGDNAFARIYSGTPPWQHIDASFLIDRLSQFFTKKTFISLPLLGLVLYAFKTRQIILVTPVFAFLPWLTVNLLAIAESAGTIMGYYAYPLLFIFCWPILSLDLTAHDKEQSRSTKSDLIKFTGLMLLASIILYRVAPGSHAFRLLNPVNVKLLWNGTFERHKCVVESFVGSTNGQGKIGPQYGALFPSQYSRKEVYFDDHEVLNSNYVLTWKNGYFVDRLVNGKEFREIFEQSIQLNAPYEVWNRKNIKSSDLLEDELRKCINE